MSYGTAKITALVGLPLLLFPGVSAVPGEITVAAGSQPSTIVAPGGTLTFPILIDMSAAEGLNLAAVDVRVTWDSDLLTFVGATAGTFGSVTINDTEAGMGVFRANAFDATGTTETFELLTLDLAAGTIEGPTIVEIEVLAVGDELGTSLLSNVVSRALSVCVGIPTLSGDVTGDSNVNIIDAQQVARFSVGLNVVFPIGEPVEFPC